MRTLGLLLALGIVAAGAVWWFDAGRDRPGPLDERYRLAAIDHGPIERTVSASGTLNPVTMVSVGTQVSGTIRALHVDFNEPVKAGQPLAEIDPVLIEAQLLQLEANLQEASAQLRLAQRRLARSEELQQRGFISTAQVDDERQSAEVAQARVRAIRAQIDRERANLGYTVIRSPIDGVVIARTVDVGQTVAASFQTPQLFVIARDLRDMQIDTNVAEADIGELHPGMPATFRVDALGDRVFEAKVRQIRLNPKVEQNVVTYNVVLSTRNDDGRLLPGMTATVRIRIEGRTDALRVPSTALRFRPSDPSAVVAPPAGAGEGAAPAAGAAASMASANRSQASRSGAGGRAVLHVESVREGLPVLMRVPVTVGISDGSHTELRDAGPLKAGDRVAIGELVAPGKAQPAGGGGFRLRLF